MSDLGRESDVDARRVLGELPVDPIPTERAQPGWPARLDEHVKDGLLVHVVSQRLLQDRVDVYGEASHPADCRGAGHGRAA